MRRARFLALILLVLPFAVWAQTVDEIIAKSAAARGGLDKIRAVQTMRVTGDFEVGGVQAGFVMVQKRPDKVRRDITVQGLNLVMAYDGLRGWQIIPFTGKKDPEPMAADDLKQIQDDADIDGSMIDYQKKGNKVELVGKEKVEGTDAYHLKVTLKNGDIRHIYLDADSFLVIKEAAKITQRGTELDVETTLGDYKPVNGLLFPFSLQSTAAGGQMPPQKITISKVEINVPLDDSSFKMPAAPAAPPAANPPAKPESGSKPPLQ